MLQIVYESTVKNFKTENVYGYNFLYGQNYFDQKCSWTNPKDL